jgi:hypothetical protein
MCGTIKDSITECQCDVDSDQSSKATEELICKKLNSDANKVTIPQWLPMSFTFGDSNSHKFLLVNIPTNILESIYSAVVEFPLTQYEVICSALKQICLYKSFRILFPKHRDMWQQLVEVLKEQFFHYHSHLDVKELNVTVLISHGPMAKEQQPHMDYSWETILLPNRRESKQIRSKYLRASSQIPFTGHMPVNPDGAYIYLWNGPGSATLYHITYGTMLIIRGDVVHCGGMPSFSSLEKLYHRIHFFFHVHLRIYLKN